MHSLFQVFMWYQFIINNALQEYIIAFGISHFGVLFSCLTRVTHKRMTQTFTINLANEWFPHISKHTHTNTKHSFISKCTNCLIAVMPYRDKQRLSHGQYSIHLMMLAQNMNDQKFSGGTFLKFYVINDCLF